MLKTILIRTGEAILLMTFLIGSFIALADTFGWLDEFPLIQQPIAEMLPKITLLLVGFLGSTLIFQYWLSIKDIEKDARLAAESTDKIQNILTSVDELRYPTQLLKTRYEMLKALYNALDKAPANAVVDVTHFEKLMGMEYDVGEGGIEKLFMERWEAKVKSGDIQVRQIVHVSCLYDLAEVEKRLASFGDCQNFSLNIIYGEPPIPYIDLLIISRHWACIDLSTDAVQPYRSSIGIEFHNPAITDAVTRYFEIWWSCFSTPIKIKNRIDRSVIDRLKVMLHDSQSWRSGRKLSEFSLLAQKDEPVRRLVDAIILTASHTHTPAATAIFVPEFANIIAETARKLPAIITKPKKVERAYVETVLMNLVTSAGERLQAVSYDPEQQNFWNCAFGEKFLQANAEAVRDNVNIVRIFILSAQQLMDSRNTCALLRKQADIGVSTYYIAEDKVAVEMRRDFLIQDGRITFEMEVSNDPAPVKTGTMHIDAEYAARFMAHFDALLKVSAAFAKNQKTL